MITRNTFIGTAFEICVVNLHACNTFCLQQLIAQMFMCNYLLCCSKFSYVFRPAEAFLREDTEAIEYNFGIKCRRECA
jgi:hypothetical protein